MKYIEKKDGFIQLEIPCPWLIISRSSNDVVILEELVREEYPEDYSEFKGLFNSFRAGDLLVLNYNDSIFKKLARKNSGMARNITKCQVPKGKNVYVCTSIGTYTRRDSFTSKYVRLSPQIL